ncbi:hypothetical protein [Streptomyces sp. NPDC001108]
MRQALWRQRRALAAGLALTAAVLGVTVPGGGGTAPGGAAAYGAGSGAGEVPERGRPPGRRVSAPVRIADAGAVRLLRPGDRVDVVSAGRGGPGSDAGDGDGVRVLAKGALVAEVPPPPVEDAGRDGALIVLSVPRSTATALAGAAISSPLAVTLC